MKRILTLVFILMIAAASAQKRYDCVIRLKEPQLNKRRVGRLVSVTDSSLVLFTRDQEMRFHWSELQLVRFRKQHGYMKTYFPLSFAGGVAGAAVAVNQVSGTNSSSCNCLDLKRAIVAPGGFFLGLVAANIVELTVYFLTRYHSFPITDYADFKRMKFAAGKYIITGVPARRSPFNR